MGLAQSALAYGDHIMRAARHSFSFALVLLFCTATSIASPAQTLTTLATFTGPNGDTAQAPLTQGLDGNFYSTTSMGGANGYGTFFKITTNGTLTSLYSFCSQQFCSDGSTPLGGLLLRTDGNFYGTTNQGGSGNNGTVFKMTPGGTLTILHTFNSFDGPGPNADLVQGADGNLYGTTGLGGNLFGSVFKLTLGGTFSTVYSFCSQPNCADGSNPSAGLTIGTDGNFYGTTSSGGSHQNCYGAGCGTVFRMTPEGAITTLYNFCARAQCSDGSAPNAVLVLARDGNFYGTTWQGGSHNLGTIFKITPSGTFTTLHSFSSGPLSEGPSGLIQATDGNFYGTTQWGGTFGLGDIFKITPAGLFTSLYSFCPVMNCQDGTEPLARPVQGTDGKLYGTTSNTVYSLSTGLAPFITFQPTSGPVGTQVTILGTNLSGATSLSFNGTPATILANTGSAITTTVPAGATTGTVQVTLPGRTVISNTDFQVVGPIQLVPITPCRLVDTRNGNPIQGGSSQTFTISQLGCGIPTSAAAYALKRYRGSARLARIPDNLARRRDSAQRFHHELRWSRES
jgi:uncharacterized repeat protein (TIGR03803 family)